MDPERRRSLRERPQKQLPERKAREKNSDYYEDDDYHPDSKAARQNDNKRKGTKRKEGGRAAAPYDEYGHLKMNGFDVCDCMETDCPGCFFECPKCGSTKCGLQCRVNRRFYYESISYDGKDLNIRNPFFPK